MDVNILYINLAYRTDRDRALRKNLEKYGFDKKKVHRIDAVLNTQCGHIGCGESHIKAINLAIANKWDKVLILEDDFLFERPTRVVKTTLENLDAIKWDVVLLAAGFKIVNSCSYSFLKRVKSCTTTSGYIVKSHYYKTLLKNFEDAVRIMKNELNEHLKKLKLTKSPFTKLNYCTAIDQYWDLLQKKDVFYLCDPVLGEQYGGYSDNNCTIEYQTKMMFESKSKK